MSKDNWFTLLFFGPALLALVTGIAYSLVQWTRQPQAKVDYEKVQNWGCLPASLLFIGIIAFVFLRGSLNESSYTLILVSPFSAFCVYLFWNAGLRLGAQVTEVGRAPLAFVRKRGGVGITIGLGIVAAFMLIVLAFGVAVLESVMNDFLGFSGPPPGHIGPF